MLCCGAATGAEPQEPERIKYRGEMLSMFATPLEFFFNAANPKPSDIADTGPTCCLRKYGGTWEIGHDELRLVSMRVHTIGATIPLPLTIISADWKSPVTASWFTGRIRIGKGKTIQGWSSVRGITGKEVLDLEIEIKAGRVVSVREISTSDMPKSE